ncbi:gustatory receptor 88 [Tribolium castaneum]|uniref:Gustatory receptor n=1 Tax=Tribolium castaneum TaxID=7070 RepID=D6WCP0_TRICA|nr:PREDICTED: uncharacterized protein LOC107397443 isoform X1 [Tribolium castaneum]EEZ99385.1 gustatory receptor 88 [Tribolium castaneum]|eukprot:XP_015832946.1 PREDICTED: uncharacterized protein LOC107397443 isoform X1 [Tribolium castaneum]
MTMQSDCSYIKSLYVTCNILGFLPPHNLGTNPLPVSLRFKIYTLCHIFLSIFVFFYSSFGRETYLYDSYDPTVGITDKIANVTLSLLSVVLRVFFVFWNGKSLKEFLNRAYEISKKEEFKCFSPRYFNLQFIGFNCYMVLIIGFDGWVWNSTVGFRIFRYYVGRSVMYYASNTVVFFVSHSALIIKRLFVSLNLLLEDELGKILGCKKPELRKIRIYYNQICGLCDNFNKIFGFVILSVIIFTISYILNLTDLLLVYAVRKKEIKGFTYGNDLIVLSILWMLTLLIFSFFLAHSCAKAVSETDQITTICFNYLNKISTVPKNYEEFVLKEEINLLLRQVTIRRPKFSAAGFFPVDFTLLGFILASVTSYIIVSIQFIQ